MLCPPCPPCLEGEDAQCRGNQPVPHLLPALEFGVPLLAHPFDPLGPRESRAEADAALFELRDLERRGVAFGGGQIDGETNFSRVGCHAVDAWLSGLRKVFRVAWKGDLASVREAYCSRFC